MALTAQQVQSLLSQIGFTQSLPQDQLASIAAAYDTPQAFLQKVTSDPSMKQYAPTANSLITQAKAAAKSYYDSNPTAKMYHPDGADQAGLDYWTGQAILNGPQAAQQTFNSAVSDYAKANPVSNDKFFDVVGKAINDAVGKQVYLSGSMDYDTPHDPLTPAPGTTFQSEIAKWNAKDPSIDPAWAQQFNVMRGYFKEGQMNPGSQWIADPAAAARLVGSYTVQQAKDNAPNGFDSFMTAAIPTIIAAAGVAGVSGIAGTGGLLDQTLNGAAGTGAGATGTGAAGTGTTGLSAGGGVSGGVGSGGLSGLTTAQQTTLAGLSSAQQGVYAQGLMTGMSQADALSAAIATGGLGAGGGVAAGTAAAAAAQTLAPFGITAAQVATLTPAQLAAAVTAAGTAGATSATVASAAGLGAGTGAGATGAGAGAGGSGAGAGGAGAGAGAGAGGATLTAAQQAQLAGMTAAQQTAYVNAIANGASVTDALTVAGTVAGSTALTGVAKILADMGVTGTVASTLGTLLTTVLPGLLPVLAAANAKTVNPNITAGPNSVLAGANGSVVTLDPKIADTRTTGLGINDALRADSAKALADLTPTFDSYTKSNTSQGLKAGTALTNYQTSIAPVTASLTQASTDLSGLQTTAKDNQTTFGTAVDKANTGFGNLSDLNTGNSTTFKNALAPINNTLTTTGNEFQSLFDAAGANKGGYIRSVVNHIIQANDVQYGNTVQDFGNRGLSGSSFAADALGNQTRLGAQAVSDATAKATETSLGLQQGLATSQAQNAQEQLGVAQTGFNVGDTAIKTGAGLTNDALMASQAGFNAGTATVSQVASLVAQNAQVASYKAQLIQQGLTDEQATLQIQNALNQGNLTAAIQQAAATDASIATRSGLSTNNQNIASNTANTALATLGLGGNVNNQTTNAANTSNAMWGSAVGAVGNALTGATSYSVTPTSAKPSATAFWDGYKWVG